MAGSLAIAQVLFGIIYVIGIFVLREFIISKDGVLRKIMIQYFAVELYVYAGSAFYFFFLKDRIPIGIFLIIILSPKAISKLPLLWYLVQGRIKK